MNNKNKDLSIQILNDIIDFVEGKYGKEDFIVRKKITNSGRIADFIFGDCRDIYKFTIVRHNVSSYDDVD